MKSQKFNKEIGATEGGTLQLLLNMIPPEKESVKPCIRGDSWFSSVHTTNGVALRGCDSVFQINQYHASAPKDFLKEALKEAPGGVHILLEGATQDEVQLVTLGYMYSRERQYYILYLLKWLETPSQESHTK